MGNVASNGRNNDELVDNLVEAGSVTKKEVELAMRLVDRGRYLPEEHRSSAYKDSAWKSEVGEPGCIHLSAPCIYASVLENLDIQKGMSFLNVGSGTGYLSSMVGFMLGSSGINHGVELYDNLVEYAYKRVEITLKCPEVSAFDWCIPQFFVGNAFQISTKLRYDRIYCGAWVQQNRRSYFCNMLKIGGVFIVPYGDSLQRIVRQSENQFEVKNISSVTFAHLIQPGQDANNLTNIPIKLEPLQPRRLLDICRNSIRQDIRKLVGDEVKLDMRYHIKNNRESRRTVRRRHTPLVFLDREPERENENEEHNYDDHDDDDDDDRRILFAMLNQRLMRHHAARARNVATALAGRAQNRELNRRINEPIVAEVEPRMVDDADFEAIGFRFDMVDNVNHNDEDNNDIAGLNREQNRGRQIGRQLLVRLGVGGRGRVVFTDDEEDDEEPANAPPNHNINSNFDESADEEESERNLNAESNIEDDDSTPEERSVHDITLPRRYLLDDSNIAGIMNEESSGSTSSFNHEAEVQDEIRGDPGNGKRARTLTSQSEHLARKIKKRSIDELGESSGLSNANDLRDIGRDESLNLDLDDGIGHALDEPPSDIDANFDSNASNDMSNENHTAENRDELSSASISTVESADIERDVSASNEHDADNYESHNEEDDEEKEADQSEGARLQAISLAKFHTEFCHKIDETPLTKYMKEFLKYQFSR